MAQRERIPLIRPFPLRYWALALAILALFLGLVGLGFWQLQRAEEKQALLEAWRSARQANPVTLEEALGREAGQFQPVRAEGRYDGRHHYLLDNRIREGRPGFEILTPMRLKGEDRVILVNRGWLPRGKTRQDLPEIPTPAEEVSVSGQLVDPPQGGLQLGPPDPGKERWPKVVQYIDTDRVAEQLGASVVERVIRLTPESAHGFRREWQAPVSFGPERHTGYAVQWFALAATLLILCLVAILRGRSRRHDEDAGN